MTEEGADAYAFGPFYLDGARRRLLRDGLPVRLTTKAFNVLLLLVRNGGEVVGKEMFMKAVWTDSFALVNVGLGERERAFEWLEKLYDDRDEWTLWLRVAPELEGLRADTRFTNLIERIGFGKRSG